MVVLFPELRPPLHTIVVWSSGALQTGQNAGAIMSVNRFLGFWYVVDEDNAHTPGVLHLLFLDISSGLPDGL